MKRIFLLVSAIMLILLCSCSDESMFSASSGTDFYTVTAEGSSRSDQFELTAQESAEITVTVEVRSTKGSLDLVCSSTSGQVISQYNDLKEGTYSFRLTGPDTFNTAITLNRFTGTCNIHWETIGAVSTTEESPEVMVIDPMA